MLTVIAANVTVPWSWRLDWVNKLIEHISAPGFSEIPFFLSDCGILKILNAMESQSNY